MKTQRSGAGIKGGEAVAAFCFDALVAYAGIRLALDFRFGEAVPEADLREVTALMPLLFLARLGSMYAAGIYRRSFLFPRSFDLADLIQTWAAGSVILSASVFFGRMLETSRLVLLYEAAANLGGIVAWRLVLRSAARAARPRGEAAVLGGADLMQRLNRFLEIERWEFRVARALEDEAALEKEETIFLPAARVTPELAARLKGKRVFIIADVTEILEASARPVDLGGFVLLDSGGVAADHHYLLAKRAMDLLVALAVLFVLWPLGLVIAILVKFSSPGPVLFAQPRAGRGGRPFRIYKFRTMYHNAGGPGATVEGDSRVTVIGRFLRRWSLDELPQIVNVLFGTMSLVGPRPEIPSVVEGYPAWRKLVLDVAPGVTGLVQTSGRDDLTEEEKARLDLYYTLNRSFEMDVSILLKTVRAVVKYRGRA